MYLPSSNFKWYFQIYFLSQKSWCSPSVCSPAGERTASVGKCSEEVPHDVFCESDEDEEERDKIPAEPELPGLLTQECDLHKVKSVMIPLKNRKKKRCGCVYLSYCYVEVYNVLELFMEVSKWIRKVSVPSLVVVRIWRNDTGRCCSVNAA